jgi:hypothetical protein
MQVCNSDDLRKDAIVEEIANKSEVARLMRQIELEYEAAQRGMYGFAAGTGKHEFINARVENIGRYHEKLKTLVGEQEATKALAQALEQAGNEAIPEKEATQ